MNESMTALGVGLVGINARARRVVLPGFTASPWSRVVAVCSRDPAKAGDVAAGLADVSPYDDYAAMLRDPRVDAVFINTPDATHATLALAAIHAGKRVICEKPLAPRLDEAEAMARAARAAGIPTVVNFTLRSVAGPRTVARQIREGAIGTLLGFEIATYQSRGLEPRYATANALLDLGPHVADLLLWLAEEAGAGDIQSVFASMNAPPSSVPRQAAPSGPNAEVHAVVRLTGGALGQLGIVRVAHGYGNAYRALLYGSTGTLDLFYDTDAPTIRLGRGVGTASDSPWRDIPVPSDLDVSYGDFPRVHFGRIAAALAGAEPFPTFDDGVRAQRLLDAIARSADAGTAITL